MARESDTSGDAAETGARAAADAWEKTLAFFRREL